VWCCGLLDAGSWGATVSTRGSSATPAPPSRRGGEEEGRLLALLPSSSSPRRNCYGGVEHRLKGAALVTDPVAAGLNPVVARQDAVGLSPLLLD
jgi:hypothetical protein